VLGSGTYRAVLGEGILSTEIRSLEPKGVGAEFSYAVNMSWPVTEFEVDERLVRLTRLDGKAWQAVAIIPAVECGVVVYRSREEPTPQRAVRHEADT